MKSLLDEIFKGKKASDEFVVKTALLYFFELMGMTRQDDLMYMVSFIAKNSDQKKIHHMFEEKMDISFEKMVFFG
eukprot:CAMPEP_0170550434 /NCGR_PEP_ID=MMETSP0211-20121228/8503_1 /TAXON_ID=311385 /ORGANISM="Pseudokeronopsis sp., Strain OXSARD2" /LENGTH=74 /DNA_ID=CAMNT_0010856989 /DNA_START=281 /DNA_END=505 /DNA_ORIENTATION=-